jgi:choline kinase
MSIDNRKVTTAVILAAGRGTRFGNRGESIPKGLLEFGGESLIARSLRLLLSAGITQVYVVVGHLAHEYELLLEGLSAVFTVSNSLYATSGSLHSLLQIRDVVNESFLLLDSDIIYESVALASILRTHLPNATLVSGLTYSGDEVWVQVRNGLMTNLSKSIGDDDKICGEFVGITKISSQLFAQMAKYALDYPELYAQMEYEQALVAASRLEPVEVVLLENLAWGEVDNEEHERRILNDVLPRIRALESGGELR